MIRPWRTRMMIVPLIYKILRHMRQNSPFLYLSADNYNELFCATMSIVGTGH